MAIITDTTGARIATAIENLPGLSLAKTDIVDNLNSNSTSKALSANQGNVLDNKITTANNNITTVDNKVPFSFGVDNNGKYGYIKNGEETVIPFYEPEEEEDNPQEEVIDGVSYYKSYIEFQDMSRLSSYHATGNVNRWLGGLYTNTGTYGHLGMIPYINSTIRTKDYVICFDSSGPYSDGATSQEYNRIFAIDKEGNTHVIPSKSFTGIVYKPAQQLPMIFGAFDINTYDTYPQYANYWYVMQAGTRYIDVFDGLNYIGSINMFPLGWNTEFLNNGEYWCIMTCPLKNKPEILVYRNHARVAYILGIDSIGNLNPMAAKAIPLNFENTSSGIVDPIYLMCNRVYATDYGWVGLNEVNTGKNIIFKIDPIGLGSSYTLSSLHINNTYDGTHGGFVEKDNKTVTISVESYYNGQNYYSTNFIRLDSQTLSNTTVVPTNFRWTQPGYEHVPHSYKAFFDTDNYIYYIPSFGYGMYYTSTTNITHNTTALYTLPITIGSNPTCSNVINTYCRIKKSDNTVEFKVYPWAQTGQNVQCIKWLRTKDDYVWIMPPRTLLNGKFAVIGPDDEITTVDIENNSYYWTGATQACNWSGGYRWPSGYFAPRSAVNDDGIGCIIDSSGTAILLFWGNGNYRLQIYNTPGNADFGVESRLKFDGVTSDAALGNCDYNLGAAMGTVANKFIITSQCGDYMMYSVITPPEDLANGTIDLTHIAPYYPGAYAGRWIYNSDIWDYNNLWFDYTNHNKVNNKILPLSFDSGYKWGFFFDKKVAKPTN